MPHLFLRLLGILLLASSVSEAAAEVRTFQNRSGVKLPASLIGLKEDHEDTVVLKLENGQTADIPIATLSDADQEYIDLWLTDPVRLKPKTSGAIDTALYLEGTNHDVVTWSDDKLVMVIEMMVQGEARQFIILTSLAESWLDQSLVEELGLEMQAGNVVSLSETQLGVTDLPPITCQPIDLASTGIVPRGVDAVGVLGFEFLTSVGAVFDMVDKRVFFRLPEE